MANSFVFPYLFFNFYAFTRFARTGFSRSDVKSLIGIHAALQIDGNCRFCFGFAATTIHFVEAVLFNEVRK